MDILHFRQTEGIFRPVETIRYTYIQGSHSFQWMDGENAGRLLVRRRGLDTLTDMDPHGQWSALQGVPVSKGRWVVRRRESILFEKVLQARKIIAFFPMRMYRYFARSFDDPLVHIHAPARIMWNNDRYYLIAITVQQKIAKPIPFGIDHSTSWPLRVHCLWIRENDFLPRRYKYGTMRMTDQKWTKISGKSALYLDDKTKPEEIFEFRRVEFSDGKKESLSLTERTDLYKRRIFPIVQQFRK